MKKKGSPLSILKKTVMITFFVFGVVSCTLFVVGVALDLRSFDETSGGYEPPFEGWTGTPIDFSVLDQSNDGIIGRGYVLDVHLNCTTGMMAFEWYGQKFDYRVVSERALKVHKPDEACIARGFTPQF